MKNTIITFFLLITNCPIVKSQKTFSINISYPENIDTNDFSFICDNGKDGYLKISPNVQSKKNKIVLSNTFYSKFATVIITYSNKSEKYFITKSIWASDVPVFISFKRKVEDLNYLEIDRIENATELDKHIEEFKLNQYVSLENIDLDNFYENHGNWAKSDSLTIIRKVKLQKLLNKRLDFIKTNNMSYYSFWYFKTKIIPKPEYSVDTLVKLFQNLFSDSLKTSYEGQQVWTFLKGKQLKKNLPSIDFKAFDIEKNELSLSNYRGKFVLLYFWASWCKPCIEEIEKLKEIRSKYSEDKMEIVSITKDDNYTLFTNTIKKYALNWKHIFGNSEIIKLYGVSGIPVLYLIDTNGVIIYSREEEKDFTSELPILEAILKEKF